MKIFKFLVAVLNSCYCISLLYRIFTNQGEVFDYFMVFFSADILIYNIYSFVKEYRKKAEELAQNSKEDSSKTEDSSLS